MIQNLLVLSVPVHLLALAKTSRGHYHGNRVSEAGVDVAVRCLPIAHALEPVVSVRFQIVALMQGWALGLARKSNRFGLRLSGWLIEDHIRLPEAPGFGEEEELRASLSTRRIQRPAGAANNRVIPVGVPEGGAVGVQNLLAGEG